MNFEEYCKELFNDEKEHIFKFSDTERELLKKVKNENDVIFDYETIDQHLAVYMLHHQEKFFMAQDDTEYSADDYISKATTNNTNFQFVEKTIKSIESKIRAYSIIFSAAIKNSNEHFNSTNSRYDERFEELNNQLENFNEQIKGSEDNLQNAQVSLDETHKTIDNMIPNVLTVLSILISIIIAVVIVYITIFLDPDGSKTIQNVLQLQMAKYVLSGHICENVIFLLLFMLATITGRSILTSCSEHIIAPSFDPKGKDKYVPESFRSSCRNCQNKCSARKKFMKRASYIAYFNAFMICGYIVLYIWWVIEHYWTSQKTDFTDSPDIYIITILFILLFSGILTLIVLKYKKNEEQQKYLKSKIDVKMNASITKSKE